MWCNRARAPYVPRMGDMGSVIGNAVSAGCEIAVAISARIMSGIAVVRGRKRMPARGVATDASEMAAAEPAEMAATTTTEVAAPAPAPGSVATPAAATTTML